MKRSTIAALLSFVFPGAGLWYCGWRRLALANVLVAVGCPLLAIYAGFLREHIQWVFLGLAAGSAGLAHAIASGSPDASKHKF